MARENNSNKTTAITNEASIPEKIKAMKRFEQVTGFSYREGKAKKKAKKAPRYYDPKSIDEDVARLDKSQSLNGEEAARLAEAAKERGKEIGLTAGLAIAGITVLSNWATKKVLAWFDKA